MISSDDEAEMDPAESIQTPSTSRKAGAGSSSSFVPLSRADIARAHQEAALSATLHVEMNKAEAKAVGMSLDDYMKATGQWPSMHGMPTPSEMRRLKARLHAQAN